MPEENALKIKYNDIIAAIQRMGAASSDTFIDEQNNVKKLISEYKSLVSEFKNAENVSSKMKGTDFASGLDIAKNDLEKFKAQAKDFPQITATVEDLDRAIEGVGDASSLNKFTSKREISIEILKKFFSVVVFGVIIAQLKRRCNIWNIKRLLFRCTKHS